MYKTCSIARVISWLAVLSSAFVFWPPPIQLAAQQLDIDQSNGQSDAIVVHLTSGRTMTAAIDPRTDSKQLWLRWESAEAELLRPIDWNCVSSAEINGNKVSGRQFLDLVGQIRRDIPAQPVDAPTARSIVMQGTPEKENTKSIPASDNNQTAELLPVQWLQIDARPARWDNYTESDGMAIFITPLDAYGRVVPVRGTLDVDLIAEHSGVVRLPDPFSRIGHWSQSVRPEDFGSNGAVYRLPFQDVNPEFSNKLGPHGAIHATLSVPGQGTFEATNDARIRPYSLIRYRLQQTTGRRFFSEETIGRP